VALLRALRARSALPRLRGALLQTGRDGGRRAGDYLLWKTPARLQTQRRAAHGRRTASGWAA